MRGVNHTGDGGLIYAWAFDGNTSDASQRGGFASMGDIRYDTHGVHPSDINLRFAGGPVTIDGVCSAAEYGGAERIGLRRSALGTVFIQYDSNYLYVCLEQLEQIGGSTADVMIDANRSGTALAQADDYRFRVAVNGTASVAAR